MPSLGPLTEIDPFVAIGISGGAFSGSTGGSPGGTSGGIIGGITAAKAQPKLESHPFGCFPSGFCFGGGAGGFSGGGGDSGA